MKDKAIVTKVTISTS